MKVTEVTRVHRYFFKHFPLNVNFGAKHSLCVGQRYTDHGTATFDFKVTKVKKYTNCLCTGFTIILSVSCEISYQTHTFQTKPEGDSSQAGVSSSCC